MDKGKFIWYKEGGMEGLMRGVGGGGGEGRG